MSRLISLLGLLVALAGIGLLVGQVVAVHSPIVPVTPVASPGAGSYASTQSVTLASLLSTSIYYTVDGSTPSCAGTGTSSLYSTAISVTATETIEALGCVGAYQPGGVLSAAYTINGAAGTPTFSPAAGTISSGTTVTISTSASGCSSYIYWSFINNPPTNSDTNSTTSSAITTTSTLYAKVIGCPGWSDSSVGSAAYTVSVTGWSSAPICHGTAAGNGANTLVSTSAVNCTGANWYYLAIVNYSASGNCSAKVAKWNDGSDHTFTLHTTDSAANNTSACIWYAENVTGASSVIFKATTDYGAIFAGGWSGGATSSSIDQQNAVTALGCYGCTTTVTPTADNTLNLVIGTAGAANPITIAEGTGYYTTLDTVNFNSGVSEGGRMFYRVISGELTAVSYVSGLSVTGTPGQTCLLSSFNGGGSGATASLLINTLNTAVGSTITVTNNGTGYTSTPTSATVASGTATCTGTPVLTSTTNGGNGVAQAVPLTNPGGSSGTARSADWFHQ